MRYSDVAIPAGMAWSPPFVKWQGSLAEVSSIDLAADVTARALAGRHLGRVPGRRRGGSRTSTGRYRRQDQQLPPGDLPVSVGDGRCPGRHELAA
jgi:hypothetical protein